MELTDLRSLMTVVSFFVFAGIVAWAWMARQREGFDEAARLPFADDAVAVAEGAGHAAAPSSGAAR